MKNKYNKKSNKEKNGIILPETDNINNDVNQTVDVSEDNSENISSSGHKKKGKRILLWILIVLLIAILAVCIRFWHVLRLVLNWENISAYRNSQKYTKEEIVEKMEEKHNIHYYSNPERGHCDLTDEMRNIYNSHIINSVIK